MTENNVENIKKDEEILLKKTKKWAIFYMVIGIASFALGLISFSSFIGGGIIYVGVIFSGIGFFIKGVKIFKNPENSLEEMREFETEDIKKKNKKYIIRVFSFIGILAIVMFGAAAIMIANERNDDDYSQKKQTIRVTTPTINTKNIEKIGE